MRLFSTLSAIALSPAIVFAAPPSVTTDIAPVHSLVAQVMGDLATPSLILPPGASPHGYAMRPSEATAISRAGLVVWVGPALTPWLERPVENLGNGAALLTLLDVDGTLVFDSREDAIFAEDHEGHTDHDDHDHDHGETDPHAWLDPVNAQVWLGEIADMLGELDPANSDIYQANARQAEADIDMLIAEITDRLAPLSDRPHVVFHDAYQYFEARFGTAPLGAISISDASAPSAARLSELRAALSDQGVVCVFAEPQFDPRLVAAVTEGTGTRTAVLDPMGVEIALGADFYAGMIRGMADAKYNCLSEG